MAVVGFSFLKINGERGKVKANGPIEINHNISIKLVEKTHLSFGNNKDEVLRIVFEFSISYGLDFGHLKLEGDIIYSDVPQIINESISMWNSEKKLPKLINGEIFKFIYNKAIIKSLELSDSLGLPAPIPMPNINFEKKKD